MAKAIKGEEMKRVAKKIPYVKHGDENVRYIRRVETTLVDDGSFEYIGLPIKSEDDLARIFSRLRESAREQAVVLFMNYQSMPIGYDLWLGGIDFVAIDPRRIISLAGTLMAAKIAVCHNHPTGPALPSDGDTMFAVQLGQLCKIMGWEFYDFMILSSGDFFSFRKTKHPALGKATSPFTVIQEKQSKQAAAEVSVITEINNELKKLGIQAMVKQVHNSISVSCKRPDEQKVKEVMAAVMKKRKITADFVDKEGHKV